MRNHMGSPDMADVVRTVICPTCGGDSVYAPSNAARPFCSERCKSLDFGAWANENFRVPTEAETDDLALDTPKLQ